MLAQNFKSAADLGITEPEQAALIKVLGMLERGDLIDASQDDECDNGFNMGTHGRGCGTPACIGGWVASLMGADQMQYVDSYMPIYGKSNGALTDLYWNYIFAPKRPGVAESAVALRNFLTTGLTDWVDAARS